MKIKIKKERTGTLMTLEIEPENMKLLTKYQADFFFNTGRKLSRNQAINLAMGIFFGMKHKWKNNHTKKLKIKEVKEA